MIGFIKKNEQGLTRTNKMREKGEKKLKIFARIELYFALKRIYRWNYKRPHDKGAEILLRYEETANMLQTLGYKLFYKRAKDKRKSWYDIDWEWN